MLTSKQLVLCARPADLRFKRRAHHPLVDRQLRPVRHLLRALLHAANLVVQETLEVEDQHGRKRVEEDLLRRVERPAARGDIVGQRFGRSELDERVFDAENVFGLDVELQSLERLDRDAVLLAGTPQDAAQLAAEDASDGRFLRLRLCSSQASVLRR